MRILLTGGTGFIGQRVGLALVRAGHSVHVLTRRPESARLAYPAQLFALEDDYGVPHQAAEGCDAVIHLAGENIASGRWTEKRRQAMRDSRVRFTENLMHAASLAGVKTVVQASAIGFYGFTHPEVEVLTEDSPRGEGYAAELCAEWEASLFESRALKDCRKVALRIGLVLGIESGLLHRLNALYAKGAGAVLGDGKQMMSWIHIDDMVGMILHALQDSSWQGVYNAVSPNPLTYREFHDSYSRLLGTFSLPPVPKTVIKLLYGELGDLILSDQNVSSRKAEKAGYSFVWQQLDDALADLHPELQSRGPHLLFVQQWIPRSLEENWAFFSDAKNLETITPEFLNFRILEQTPEAMDVDTRITYRLKLRGLPIKWTTRIAEWVPKQRFVDTQEKGPYQLWHHTHTFEELAGGTLITDLVQYKLPLDPIGSLFGDWLVSKDVENIFRYRCDRIHDMFVANS